VQSRERERTDSGSPDPIARIEILRRKSSRADVFFDAKHWTEAAIAYREIAMSAVADNDLGARAAERYLQSINVLGSFADPSRQDCWDDMAHDVPMFISLHCQGVLGAGTAAMCLDLFHIERDLERPAGCRMPNAPESDPTKIAELYAEAGLAYLQRARICCDSALRFGSSLAAERCDELAFPGF
jgi:hypothetical protein